MKPKLFDLFSKNKQILQQLMNNAQIESLEELSKRSGVSGWQLNRLRFGLMPNLSVENLVKLSAVLNIPVDKCLALFYPEMPSLPAATTEDIDQLKQDYQMLQQQLEEQEATFKVELSHKIEKLEQMKQEYQILQQELEQQKETLKQEFQQSSIEVLESWLLQWPTAAAAAQKNPQLSAVKLLALVKPIVELLKRWGVENIGVVGEKIPYDPQYHQLMNGNAVSGDLVEVRYVGYRQGNKLLYKAKVSPVRLES